MMRRRISTLLLSMMVFLLAGAAPNPASGQSVAFDPGYVSITAGDPTVTLGYSNPSYSGPASGLSFNPVEYLTVAADSHGNVYVGGSGIIRVIASGNGPIPVLPSVTNPVAGQVYPVAGTTAASPCAAATDSQGDGCPALQAYTNPVGNSAQNQIEGGLAVDANDNLFVLENSLRVIYSGTGAIPNLPKNAQAGYIYVIANAGSTTGATGDGGPALNAALNVPTGISVDGNENVYIADSGNAAIRVIYSGTGAVPNLPSGAVAGNIYTIGGTLGTGCQVMETADGYVFGDSCGDNGLATAAQLSAQNYLFLGPGVTGVYVDHNGNIFINDMGDFRVRVIYAGGTVPNVSNPQVGYIYTIAGNGYQAGSQNFNTDAIVPPGLDGPALNTSFDTLAGITGDAGGNIYISDGDYIIYYLTQPQVDSYNAIRRIDPAGNITTIVPYSSQTCAGWTNWKTANQAYGCPSNSAQVLEPTSIGIDGAGNLSVLDVGKNPVNGQNMMLVYKLSVNQTALTAASTISRPTQQVVTVSNTGAMPLQLSGIAYQGNNGDTSFAQGSTGGPTDCTATTLLDPGASCQIGINFTPESVGTFSGALVVTSNALNATNGSNLIQLTGTATQSVTTTNLAIAPEVANTGQQVTLTATLVPDFGSQIAPTGTVTFTTADGATTLGTANAVNGVATLQENSLGAGTYSIKASYSGDANYKSSISFPASLTVSSMQVPSINLAVSSSAINAGTSLTLTSSVTPYSGTVVPTGTVSFQDGVVTLGTATLDASGTATFSTKVLPVGPNSLVAVYSGDSHYASAISTPVPVAVTGTAQLQLSPGTITDAAGVYNFSIFQPNYGGDGGPAAAARFLQPQSVATDANGNLYILDNDNFIVRAVYSGQGSLPGISNPVKGNIYLLAGTPLQGCSSTTAACGDNGPAIGAYLGSGMYGYPTALAVDAAGSLYIGDGNNYRLRKVDAKSGIITTIAGTGVQGYTGDGGPATAAELGSIASLAVDNAGDVYFTDTHDFVIRRIDALSGIITTIAGTGTSGFTADGGFAATSNINPGSIALDTLGNLYLVDDIVVRKIDAKTGLLTTVAGREAAGTGYSGDGGPAIDAQFGSGVDIAVDWGGNLYISDIQNSAVRVVNAVSGIVNSIVGATGTGCNNSAAGAPCGDGGLAPNAYLSDQAGIALDPQGNLYIADTGDSVIRQVSPSPATIDFGSENQGSTATQTVTVTNTGGTLLILSSITFSDPSFQQQSSGGTDCSSTTTLKAGEQCQIAIGFFPLKTGPITGSLTIASSASNIGNGQTLISLKGTGAALGGTLPQTITFPALPATLNYGQSAPLNAVSSAGADYPITYLVSGPGQISGSSKQNTAKVTATGTGLITVTAYQFGNGPDGKASQYAAAAPVQQSTTAAGGVTLTVAATPDESYVQGAPVPALTYTITGLVQGDSTTGAPSLTTSATQNSPFGTYPIVITQGTLQAKAAYQMVFVNGTMHVTGSSSQNVNFAPVGNLTYGTSPVPLVATASSGDPVKFFVTSGPGLISGTATAPTLTITGAGQITVSAMAFGDATYKASPPTTQTITVTPHPLTITAANVTVTQGQPFLPLSSAGYLPDTTQFVNGDNASVLSGVPVLTTTATQNSAVGTYPIFISQGTLAAANYTLNFANGTLTIVQGKSQTVTFSPIPNMTYGAQAYKMSAVASSGYPVTYSIGAGTNIASISQDTVTINGAGTVTVVATQSGNSTYAPATASQTFTVAPAVATITAADVTRVNNTPNPALINFIISGLVNHDSPAVVSGTPAMTTTAQPGSPVGTYPINIASGTLQAANYTFNLVPGNLTITSGGPAADFSLTATPQVLTMLSGQTRQSVIVLTPLNYYQGLVKLSCGNLPANVSCTFSPATLAPDGTGNPVQTALTVNTSSSTPVVGALRPATLAPVSLAAVFCLPGMMTGLLLTINRRRFTNNVRILQLLVVLLCLAGAIGLTACGSGNTAKSSSNGDAAPGSSTIAVTVTGADNITHTLNLSITVE